MHNVCYFPKVNESIPLIKLLVTHLTGNEMPSISIASAGTILYYNHLSFDLGKILNNTEEEYNFISIK